MSAFNDWMKVFQYEGFIQSVRRTLGFLHEKHLRPRLPDSDDKYTRLNGVLTARTDTKLLDRYIGLINYEGPLIRSMKQEIEPGDRVVIVGGGYGVSAVVASRLAGSDGTVVVFEGAENMLPKIQKTVSVNNVTNVEIRHNVVSEAISLYGDDGGTSVIPPEELPDCDVLVLDCEGAEIDILTNMVHSPRSVVIETHGQHGAPTSEVKKLFAEYDITYEQSMSESKEMAVLGARRKQ